MTASTIYLAAGVVLVLAGLLSINTSAQSDASSAEYERMRARRTAAITLFVISIILAGFGLAVQMQAGPTAGPMPSAVQPPDYR